MSLAIAVLTQLSRSAVCARCGANLPTGSWALCLIESSDVVCYKAWHAAPVSKAAAPVKAPPKADSSPAGERLAHGIHTGSAGGKTGPGGKPA